LISFSCELSVGNCGRSLPRRFIVMSRFLTRQLRRNAGRKTISPRIFIFHFLSVTGREIQAEAPGKCGLPSV